jgi:hypothetical protein
MADVGSGRGVAGGLGPTGFGPSQVFSGGGGGFMDGLKGMFGGLGDFMGSKAGGGLMDFGSLALNAYGLNKSLGMADDQLGIMKDQEGRAATAQNFQTGNSLAMQQQMTTPGTPEHARAQEAIANGTFEV